MLSKKMAFSLMSLITLLALAFVAPSAIAADDFDAGFSVMRVSAVSDHNARVRCGILTLRSHLVRKSMVPRRHLRSSLKISLVRKLLLLHQRLPLKDLNALTKLVVENNNKVFVFTIPASDTGANDVKVHLHVTKGVAEIVPTGSVKTSKEGKLTIDLIGPEVTRLTPDCGEYRIGTRCDSAVCWIHRWLRLTLLSRSVKQPKAFKAADHLDVTHATAADPVALDPREVRSRDL